jgi:hypothetical protein
MLSYKTSKIRCSFARYVRSRMTYKVQGDVLCVTNIYELLIAAASPSVLYDVLTLTFILS